MDIERLSDDDLDELENRINEERRRRERAAFSLLRMSMRGLPAPVGML